MLTTKDRLHAALWSLGLYVVDRLVRELRRVREEFQQLNQEARKLRLDLQAQQVQLLSVQQQSLQLRLQQEKVRAVARSTVKIPERGSKTAPQAVQSCSARVAPRPVAPKAKPQAAPWWRRRGQGSPPQNRAA